MPRSALAPLLLAAALVASACGATPGGTRGATESPAGQAPASASGSPGPATTPAPATTPPTAPPMATADPFPATPDPASPPPDGPPAATPSAEPAGPAPAAACSGSDENRAFFEAIAGSVDWQVLCAVLPRGWFVRDGRYRLANGGWLQIGYSGPGGATLALHQGAACTTNGGCDPAGSELGPAALGPLDGTLHRTAQGYAIAVDPGRNPSWYLTTTGLDEAATIALARALVVVRG